MKLSIPVFLATMLMTACMRTQPPHAHVAEPIGTVGQVYDGTLTSDIQVDTFRNIDRLFPVRVVRHGTTVLALPRSDKRSHA